MIIYFFFKEVNWGHAKYEYEVLFQLLRRPKCHTGCILWAKCEPVCLCHCNILPADWLTCGHLPWQIRPSCLSRLTTGTFALSYSTYLTRQEIKKTNNYIKKKKTCTKVWKTEYILCLYTYNVTSSVSWTFHKLGAWTSAGANNRNGCEKWMNLTLAHSESNSERHSQLPNRALTSVTLRVKHRRARSGQTSLGWATWPEGRGADGQPGEVSLRHTDEHRQPKH